jgi:hypothetical protein
MGNFEGWNLKFFKREERERQGAPEERREQKPEGGGDRPE